ncbi:MAG: thioesterase family protein [Alphaproteobacteria bacterium]|nr:MAG: thioesterase family protein [Alphaproteobacteria bacterium]
MTDLSMPEILSRLKEGDTYETGITPGWMQGRATFGGLAAALAVTGMTDVLPAPAPLRSLMVSFVAPMPADGVKVLPRVARAGRNVTQTSADIVDANGQVCLQAMAAYGNSRETASVPTQMDFRPEPRDSVPPAPFLPGLPPFLQFFDIHWTGGGIPMSGTRSLRLGKWVRHKNDMRDWPVEKLVAIADIPPPVMMSHYKTPVRASSLSWSLEFLCDPAGVESDWFYLDYRLEHAADGYSQQSGAIFTEAGELVALSRQCMVYFE